MSAKIISGKQVSAELREKLKAEAAAFAAETGITPGLAVVIVGQDPASTVYVRNKHKACIELGYYSEVHELPEETSEAELLQLIERLNADEKLHGIMVKIYKACYDASVECGKPGDLMVGANVAGFLKVAEAMLWQGVC